MTDWTIAAFTHRGRVRAANEDAIAVGADVLTGDMDTPVTISTSGDRCLLMVADGIGGHAQGARASRAVLDYLVATADRISSPESCADAIEEANQRLYVLMRQRQEAFGMGTTLAGVIILPTAMLTFNVGDSRCYLFSNRRLIQLSHDDVEDGMKTRSGERRSHVITQALGGHSFLSVDPHINVDAPLGPKEALVLCTDGLTDMVSDDSIALTLNVTDSPAQTVRILAGKAFASGEETTSLWLLRAAQVHVQRRRHNNPSRFEVRKACGNAEFQRRRYRLFLDRARFPWLWDNRQNHQRPHLPQSRTGRSKGL